MQKTKGNPRAIAGNAEGEPQSYSWEYRRLRWTQKTKVNPRDMAGNAEGEEEDALPLGHQRSTSQLPLNTSPLHPWERQLSSLPSLGPFHHTNPVPRQHRTVVEPRDRVQRGGGGGGGGAGGGEREREIERETRERERERERADSLSLSLSLSHTHTHRDTHWDMQTGEDRQRNTCTLLLHTHTHTNTFTHARPLNTSRSAPTQILIFDADNICPSLWQSLGVWLAQCNSHSLLYPVSVLNVHT